MKLSTAETLHSLYRVALGFELAAILFLLFAIKAQSSSAFALLLFLFPVAVGFAFSVAAMFVKPRSLDVWLGFGLHMGIGLMIFGPGLWEDLRYAVYDGPRARALEERREACEDIVQQARSGDAAGAKKRLKASSSCEGLVASWQGMICPSDGSAPDLELLKLMGEHGGPRDGDLLVEAAACSLPLVKAVQQLGITPIARASDGRTALFTATDPEVLAFFIQSGVRVDARLPSGETALMFHRSPEVTQFLLDHGADPKATDKLGRTALHHGGPERVLAACYERLLKAGADPNQRDATKERNTPLLASCAIYNGHRRVWNQEAADMLVAHGADASIGDVHGQTVFGCLIDDWQSIAPLLAWRAPLTPLQLAYLLEQALTMQEWDSVMALLDAGADPLVRCSNGRTPLQLCADKHGGGARPTEGDWACEPLYQAGKRLHGDAVPQF